MKLPIILLRKGTFTPVSPLLKEEAAMPPLSGVPVYDCSQFDRYCFLGSTRQLSN